MSKLILLVEDDDKNRKLFRDLLQVSGYTVLEARDGRTGVEQARAHKPALILMDIRMPIMDGLEATRLLKTDLETGSIPIVALTASALEAEKERIMAAGFDGYVTKPIDVRKFLELVAAHV